MTATCPVCTGPIEWVAGEPRCPLTHPVDHDELPRQVSEAATLALWSAVRALEDTASAARWRLSRPDPAPYLQGVVDKATVEVVVLRDLLARWKEQERADAQSQIDVHEGR